MIKKSFNILFLLFVILNCFSQLNNKIFYNDYFNKDSKFLFYNDTNFIYTCDNDFESSFLYGNYRLHNDTVNFYLPVIFYKPYIVYQGISPQVYENNLRISFKLNPNDFYFPIFLINDIPHKMFNLNKSSKIEYVEFYLDKREIQSLSLVYVYANNFQNLDSSVVFLVDKEYVLDINNSNNDIKILENQNYRNSLNFKNNIEVYRFNSEILYKNNKHFSYSKSLDPYYLKGLLVQLEMEKFYEKEIFDINEYTIDKMIENKIEKFIKLNDIKKINYNN